MLPFVNMSFEALGIVDVDGVHTGVKTVRLNKKNKPKPFKTALMKVGDVFPFNRDTPNVMTIMGTEFVSTNDEVLEDDAITYMQGSDAVPADGLSFFHIFLAKDDTAVDGLYNVLIVVTTGRNMLFSMSLATMNRPEAAAGVYELNKSVDLYIVDSIIYIEQVRAAKERLATQLRELRATKEDLARQQRQVMESERVLTQQIKDYNDETKIPPVMKAEFVLSTEELKFKNELDPVDPSIKKRQPRKRTTTAPNKRDHSDPVAPKTPPPSAKPNRYQTTPTVVTELDDGDSDDMGRPASKPPVQELSDDSE